MPEAKLALLEFLLSNTTCRYRPAARSTGSLPIASVEQAVVAMVGAVRVRCCLVAEHGVSSSAVVDFSLPRDDEAHPLIARDGSSRADLFRRLEPRSRPDRRRSVPRDSAARRGRNSRPRPAAGQRHRPDLHPDVAWLGRILGRQVSRLFSRQTFAETRFGQERMLLYSIINAVTDPILLTDTEGKLIIANTHAEKLFAAPEDASEGWRRAAGLNNMLFSAALSTNAVAQTDLARRELLLVDPLEGSDLLFELLSSRATDERQGTYVVSILRNVTDLARAKEEIEESYRTLRARPG